MSGTQAHSLIPNDSHERVATLGQSIFVPPFFLANGRLLAGRLSFLIVFLLVLPSQNSQLFTQSTLEGLNLPSLLQIKRTVSNETNKSRVRCPKKTREKSGRKVKNKKNKRAENKSNKKQQVSLVKEKKISMKEKKKN